MRTFALWYGMYPTRLLAPRAAQRFEKKAEWLQRLTNSVQMHGIINPVCCWHHTNHHHRVYNDEFPDSPRVIWGKNRLLVALELELSHVPAIISMDKGIEPPGLSLITPSQIAARCGQSVWADEYGWGLVTPQTEFFDGSSEPRCPDNAEIPGAAEADACSGPPAELGKRGKQIYTPHQDSD